MVPALRLALLGLVVACTNGTPTDTTDTTDSVTDADSGTDTGSKTTTLPPATLFWSESPADCKSTTIRAMAPDASVPVDIVTLDGPDGVHDLAVDGAGQTIYFTFGASGANKTEEVRRVQVDGTKSARFALLPETGRGIALDAGAGNLYWVMDDNTINMASLGGGTPQAVFTQPRRPSPT